MSETTVVYPSPQHLRVLMRSHRRARYHRPFGDAALDVYVVLFCVLVSGAMVLSTAYDALSDTSRPVALGLPGIGQWLVVWLTILAVGGLLRLFGDVGPIVVGQAVQTWLLATPVSQRGLLLPRVISQTLLGAAAGGLAGWLVAGMLNIHPGRPLLIGIGLAVAAHSVTACAQIAGGRMQTWRRGTNILLALAALVVIGLVVAGRLGAQGPEPGWNSTAIALTALAFAVLSTVAVVARLDRLTREALGQIDLVNAAGAAVVMMDPAGLAAVLDARRWRRIGRVRSQRLGGTGMAALLRADLLRQARHPSGMLWWSALLLVPHMAAVLDTKGLPPTVLVTLTATVATGRLARGLREICRSAALRQALGLSELRVRLIHLAVPAAGATTFVVVCVLTGVAGLTWPVAAMAAAAAPAAVYRRATVPVMTWTGAYIETPFGMVPADLLQQVFRGPLLLSVAIFVQYVLSQTGLG